MFNLDLAATAVRKAAAITTKITGEVIPSDKPGCIALVLKEPLGVILKASETCPQTHSLIIEAFAEVACRADRNGALKGHWI